MTDAPLADELHQSRRRLITEGAGIAVSAVGFGFVYGLSARDAGFSPIEAMAMSTIVFAGAAQFAAVGYIASGLAWPAIILLTALLNVASSSPWITGVDSFSRGTSSIPSSAPVSTSSVDGIAAAGDSPPFASDRGRAAGPFSAAACASNAAACSA